MPTPSPAAIDLTDMGLRATRVQDGTRHEIDWREVQVPPAASVGLVLGAGGVTGLAFLAGLLLALETDHGLPVHRADRVVGTSAGSVAGSLIAHGFTAGDLAAVVADAPAHLSLDAATMRAVFRPAVPPMPGLHRVFRWPTPGSMFHGARLTLQRQWLAALVTSLRDGAHDLRPDLEFLVDVGWPTPAERLSICVTDAQLGSRRVLGHADGLQLLDCLLASCAIPSVLRPGVLDGRRYVDGGISSPTNADVVAGAEQPQVVIVLSPMSGPHARTLIGRLAGRFAAARLGAELRRFSRAQTVYVLEPTRRLSELILDDTTGGAALYRKVLAGAFVAAGRRDRVPIGATVPAMAVDV